jgi:hypothetical protein
MPPGAVPDFSHNPAESAVMLGIIAFAYVRLARN